MASEQPLTTELNKAWELVSLGIKQLQRVVAKVRLEARSVAASSPAVARSCKEEHGKS